MVSPPQKREGVQELVEAHGQSERHACHLVGMPRSSGRYMARSRHGEAELRACIRRLALDHRAYGCAQITYLLRREGVMANSKIRCQKPAPHHWLSSSLGRSGFHLDSVASNWDSMTNAKGSEIRVDLIITGPQAKEHLPPLNPKSRPSNKSLANKPIGTIPRMLRCAGSMSGSRRLAGRVSMACPPPMASRTTRTVQQGLPKANRRSLGRHGAGGLQRIAIGRSLPHRWVGPKRRGAVVCGWVPALRFGGDKLRGKDGSGSRLWRGEG